MTLTQLKYFVQIAESGSFSKAAQKLFVSQPSLNFSINALEEELGLVLFSRSRKGVVLTQNGKKVFQDAKEILQMVDMKYFNWKQMDYYAIVEDSIDVFTMPIHTNFILKEVIYNITSYYPGLKINLYSAHYDEIVEKIKKGEIEIAIVNVFETNKLSFNDLLKKNHFVAQALLPDEYCIFFSKDNFFAKQQVIRYTDISSQLLATYSNPTSTNNLFAKNLLKYVPSNKVLRLDSLDNILQIVADNKAITAALKNMVRNNQYVREGSVQYASITDFPYRDTCHYIVYKQEDLLSANQLTVIDYIIQQFKKFYRSIT